MTTSAREYRKAILELLPEQGDWGEEEYLWLSDHANRLVEFNDGKIEVLPMPSDLHQVILFLLARGFFAYIDPRGGIVLFSPLRLRLRPGKVREPDMLLLLDRQDSRRENRYWHGADLVLEVVRPDRPERDLVEKRQEYAEAGIPEYWIVNPLNRTITVLTLAGNSYVEHGVFARGSRATSALLEGFGVAVDEVFSAS